MVNIIQYLLIHLTAASKAVTLVLDKSPACIYRALLSCLCQVGSLIRKKTQKLLDAKYELMR